MNKKKYFILASKIFLFITMLNTFPLAHSLTIKSGQVISSDGKVYDFASPKEIESLIKESISGGKSMGFFNNSLLLIIEKNILHIPFQEIVTSTDKQITNLVNKETDKFIKKNNIEESDRLIKHRLILGAKKLKRLYLLNKLQKNLTKNRGSYISFYFSF